MPTILDAATMIADAYNAKTDANGIPFLENAVTVPTGWVLREVIDHTSTNGDYAAVFVNSTTSEIFIAGRGTAAIGDALPDAGIGLGILPSQRIADATAILTSLQSDPNYQGYTISAGGHSLDGEVYAQVSENQAKLGITFPVLALVAPNTFSGSVADVNVIEISAKDDFIVLEVIFK